MKAVIKYLVSLPAIKRLTQLCLAICLLFSICAPAVVNAQATGGNNNVCATRNLTGADCEELLRLLEVYFDDPVGSSCAGGGSTILVGSANEEQAWNFLIGKGLTPVQAAGMMGNMMREAHFEPRLVEYGYRNSRGEVSVAGSPTSLDDKIPPNQGPAGQPGYGIIQWTSPGRKQGLQALATSTGRAVSDFGLQLDFMWSELQGPYKTKALDPLMKTNDLAQATRIIQENYEVGTNFTARYNFALAILAKYGSGGGGGGSGPIVSPTPVGGCASGGGGGVGNYKNPFRDVPNIKQWGIDAGVDYGGDGPVYAIGNGTVVKSSTCGWIGGNCASYKLSDGAAAGKVIYIAENCTYNPALKPGDPVTSNTIMCTMHSVFPYIETGWAQEDSHASGGFSPLAYVDKCYKGYANPPIPKSSTTYGVNFDQLMTKLGAPKASLLSGPITCTLPSGWPTW